MFARLLEICQGTSCGDAAIEQLRVSLHEFYETTDQYSAFEPGSELRDESCYFEILRPEIERVLAEKKKIRVLELGAGRPNFPRYFSEFADQIEYHAQDVTSTNTEYLNSIADKVHIMDVSEIEGQFDLVFSKFVLEHVVEPQKLLRSVESLLSAGGVHAIFCPRYDMPGYLCPSIRHRDAFTRYAMTLFLAGSRLMAMLDRKPRFWINLRPAVLEVENWYRDADAIHVVSLGDLIRWHRRHGFSVCLPKLAADGGWRLWVLRRLLTVSLVAKKKRE